MNKIWQGILVVVVLVVVFGGVAYLQSQVPKQPVRPTVKVAVSEQWIEKDGETFLRVNYGGTVLDIPEKYNPLGINDKTQFLDFFLFGSSLKPNGKNVEGHHARVLLQPIETGHHYNDDFFVDSLLKHGYELRDSVDYPNLKEYWHAEKQKAHHFYVNYQPDILVNYIQCIPGYKKRVEEKTASSLPFKLGDTSCRTFANISKTLKIEISFDARLLHEAEVFHRNLDQFIHSLIIQY